MNPDITPTVFVALSLTPNQFCLFEELEVEAVDVLNERIVARSVVHTDRCESVFLDSERIRLALSWSSLVDSDVLTLAMGPRSDPILGTEDARRSAEQLRELVKRGEALFDVGRSVWQISLRPLDEETLRSHAARLEAMDGSEDPQDSAFVDFNQNELPNPQAPAYFKKATGLFEKLRLSFKAANEEPSWAMQASALALSSTFVLVTPPVGIAMFTYAALRQGTDMDLLPRNLEVAKWAAGQQRSSVNKRGLKVSIVVD